MNRIPRGLFVVVAIAIVVPMVFFFFFKRVEPMEIGVKQLRFGGSGVVEQDHEAGFHLGITGVHRWYFLPRSTHFLHFVSSAGRDSATTMWKAPLRFRTKDNNEPEIEVTVPYRIKPGEAHKIVQRGLRQGYRGRVNSTVEAVLRSQLAELTSEDLQDTDTRVSRAQAVLPLLNDRLEEFHVIADGILIRRVSFPAEYEAKLQEKQYLTQKANLDGAQELVAVEAKVTNSIEKQIGAAEAKLNAEWDIRFQDEQSRYQVLIAEIRAEAKKYEARTKAEGDAELVRLRAEGQLALDQARALRDRLRNEALGTAGGRIYLALEAAQNLRVPTVMLNSNDPRVPLIIDLDEMSRVLVGSSSDAP